MAGEKKYSYLEDFDFLGVEGLTPAQQRYWQKKTGEAIRIYYATGKMPPLRKGRKSCMKNK